MKEGVSGWRRQRDGEWCADEEVNKKHFTKQIRVRDENDDGNVTRRIRKMVYTNTMTLTTTSEAGALCTPIALYSDNDNDEQKYITDKFI